MTPYASESLEIKSLKKVIERLEKESIGYMLTGSMALNFYGHPRATNDFDIVIEVQKNDGHRLLKLFESDFYISPQAVNEALNLERMFNIVDLETIFKTDLIVRKGDSLSQEQFSRRRLKDFAGLKAFVISPEDLILSKLQWSKESLSEMQERDIRNLIDLLSKDLDCHYMESRAGQIGMLDRLKRYYVSS